MSHRSRKTSRSRRARQQRTTRIALFSIGGVILAGVVALIALSARPSAEPVTQARLERDPTLGSPEAPVQIVELLTN